MHFSGLGSMMQPHFRKGPIERPYAASPTEEALRELYFFDLLAAGIYIARRGMIAMSLPIGDAECDRLVGGRRGVLCPAPAVHGSRLTGPRPARRAR